MYLMYVDESGDSGLPCNGSQTDYFILTGLVVHDSKWHEVLDKLIAFRRRMQKAYGLRLREELHAARLFTNPGDLARIPKHSRLAILRDVVSELASISEISVVNVVVNKKNRSGPYDPFREAWKALVQRFENTMQHANFPGCIRDQRGLIICDQTNEKKLRSIMRAMRRYNPIPNQPQHGAGYRNIPLQLLIEDPNMRDSRFSLFVQACDVLAYVLYQQHTPNRFIRRKGARNLANALAPVYNRYVSNSGRRGVVML